MCLAFRGLPIDQKSDGVFRLRNTIIRFACGDTGGCTGDYANWNRDVLENPAANINVVRREVVAKAGPLKSSNAHAKLNRPT